VDGVSDEFFGHNVAAMTILYEICLDGCWIDPPSFFAMILWMFAAAIIIRPIIIASENRG